MSMVNFAAFELGCVPPSSLFFYSVCSILYLRDQALEGGKGLITVVDDMDLETILFQSSLGSVDTIRRGSLAVGRVGQRSDLSIRLRKTLEGFGKVRVLGARHCKCGEVSVGVSV